MRDIGGTSSHEPIKADQYTCCLIAGDFHVGAFDGLMRPGFVTAEGHEIGLNDFQAWLWENFTSCIAEAVAEANGRPFPLIINGDAVAGRHHGTREVVMSDEVEHANAAIYTLQPLIEKAAEVFVTEGTEAHTKQLEHYIAKTIGATPPPGQRGKYAFDILDISINGCLGSVRHHMPTTAREYLDASQLGIQAGNAQLSYARSGRDMPKWFAAAHRHKPGEYTNYLSAAWYVTPCWQGLTRYARKVVPDGYCTPGFIWLDWEKRKHGKRGDLPVDIGILREPKQRSVVER